MVIQHQGQTGGSLTYTLTLPQPDPPFTEQVIQQARRLGGAVKERDKIHLQVTIPFDTSQQLATVLNRIGRVPYLPQVTAEADVFDQNLLLFVRERFRYDIDLRPLGIESRDQAVLVAPQSLLNFQLALETPWGARPIERPAMAKDTVVNPHVQRGGDRLTWTLMPGYLNHLEAVYWYPSPLGWGTLVIVSLLMLGSWLRTRLSGSA
ncbi:DUF3153 domain-containing protein [Thermosynechococcus sp.]|uniref:DUF3153 domain-containing protein n=1 Tax=Thermosynechococcus sp. TaxID=2814275 RepID=UPI00262B39F9|nr:DUF3153 domain-containing protein [Thermosynechococcus sp.]